MARTVLIVSAHPNPDAFTHAWARASARAAQAQGARVLVSDLYAMRFQAADLDLPDGVPGDPLKRQESAPPPPDIAAEVAKIRAADQIVFHFPLWWFGPPAIIKGWFDRCLVHGTLHRVDQRFDSGILRGKRALFCVTTGAPAAECGPDGKEADTRLLLWPHAYTLRYCGMDVAQPLIVHGVHGYHEGAAKEALDMRLTHMLDGQAQVIATLADRPLIPFNRDSDFDESGRLRADAPSHSPFISR